MLIDDYSTWNINKVVKQMHQFRTHISYKHGKISILVLLTKSAGPWEALCFLSYSHDAVINDPGVNVTIDDRSLVVTQVVFPFDNTLLFLTENGNLGRQGTEIAKS